VCCELCYSLLACLARCAEQFFNRKEFLFVTRFREITARLKKLMAEGGDLSDFRIDEPNEDEVAMQYSATCAGATYTRELTKSAVQGGYYLSLGKDSEVVTRLPKEDCVVQLIDAEGEVFAVKYKAQVGKQGFSGGWKAFARGHALECGDKITLTMTAALQIKVTIVRGNVDSSDESEEALEEEEEVRRVWTPAELMRAVMLLWDFTAEMHGKGGGDGLIHDVKNFLRECLRKEERWAEFKEGEEYCCPHDAASLAREYAKSKADGKLGMNGLAYSDSKWEIIHVPEGRVNYDALVDAMTVKGCMQYSSYIGLGNAQELWMRKLTCTCSMCMQVYMGTRDTFVGCENADWLALPVKVMMTPRTKADARVLISDTLTAIDEYTSQIQGSCSVVVVCELDDAGRTWYPAKTVGRLRVVVEGAEFTEDDIFYDVGDKYFVVYYFSLELIDDKKPLSRANVVENSYNRGKVKGCVHNHLLLHHYGFDMPYHTRSRERTTYKVPNHDLVIISKMTENGYSITQHNR
jgi:hypothetical protein